jgi:hypothetical protein
MSGSFERTPRSSWRDKDLRGQPERSPASVSFVVHRTHRALSMARLGESVLLGLAAAFVLLASALRVGVDRADAQGIYVAGFGGLLAASAWWLEHRTDARRIARGLDRRLRYQGGLVTAYGIERSSGTGVPVRAMERLVCEAVLARLRPAEAMRAMFPPLLLPIVAPVLAAGFLLMTLEEARPGATRSVDVSRLSSAMVEAVGALGADTLEARQSGRLAPGDAEDLLGLWNRLKDLDRRLELGREATSAELAGAAEACRAIEKELSRLVRRTGGAPELRERLGIARNYLEALRSGLGEIPGGGALAGGPRDPNGLPSSTGEGSKGTISGSSLLTEDSANASTPFATASAVAGESGGGVAGSGRFWPAAYDLLVARWVEARRSAQQEHHDPQN